MEPFFIVTLQPFCADLSHLLQGFKHIGVQHFRPVGPIIAIDEGILIPFPWFNVSEISGSLGTPAHESLGEEFRTIVEANCRGWPRQLTTCPSTRMTRSAGSDVSTPIAKSFRRKLGRLSLSIFPFPTISNSRRRGRRARARRIRERADCPPLRCQTGVATP
jgi:hypothetical protein